MERPYLNDPRVVVSQFLRTRDPHFLDSQDISRAVEVFRGYPRRDAYGLYRDLESAVSHRATQTMARMFHEQHTALPQHWRDEPEIMRTVISMSAEIDLGNLRARQLHEERDGGNQGIEEQVVSLTQLLSSLQVRAEAI